MTLNAYELMLVLQHEADDEARAAVLDRVKQIIESADGSVTKEDEWGKRRFAYEIDHMTEGYYYVLQFNATSETVDEISRVLKITDNVIRFMPIRLEEEQLAAATAATGSEETTKE